MPLTKPLVIGEWVIAAVGSKSGLGRVEEVVKDRAIILFPRIEYPQTMVCPTGSYIVDVHRDIHARDQEEPKGWRI